MPRPRQAPVGTASTPVAVPAPTAPKVPPPRRVVVTLDAQHGGAESGEALIFQEAGMAKIVFSMTNAPLDAPQPGDIVAGTCEAPGAMIYALKPTVNGGSETKIDRTVDEFLALAPIAIRLKKSAVEAGTIVACGDIGALQAAPTAAREPEKTTAPILTAALSPAAGAPFEIHGSAALEAVGQKTQVKLDFTGAPKNVIQPASISSGDCIAPGISRYALSPSINGQSLTLLDVPAETLARSGALVVTISKSQGEPDAVVACGEIK